LYVLNVVNFKSLKIKSILSEFSGSFLMFDEN